MANSSISIGKLAGFALIVLGIGLAIWGYQLSGGFGSQVAQAVTGSETDKVMTLYIAGAVSLVVGLVLAARR